MLGVGRIEVDGPLAACAAGIEGALVAQGYREDSSRALMRLVAELSRWLARSHLGAEDLSGAVIDRFFAAGGGSSRHPGSLRMVVAHLRSKGLLPPESAVGLGGWCLSRG